MLLAALVLAIPASAAPLQPRIAAAEPGSTLVVDAGTYEGDLLLDKPLHLVGRGRPLLLGSGRGSVVRVTAAAVTIEGFDVDGREGGDLAADASGIWIAAHGVTVRDCRIARTLFGVYLREADGARVEGCVVQGIHGKDPGEKGSGIHVYDTDGYDLRDNEIVDARDGIYIQSSPHGRVTGNFAHDLRYGLHYMYSDDNLFEDNLFSNADAGTALMYSRRITFRRNRFVHNRGFASVGLLFKSCDDIVAESNLIADNARGIFLEGSNGARFTGNVVAESDAAIVLYDSCSGVRFEGNSFVANLTPLSLSGRRTDTVFRGNYWSGQDAPDLDGDGIADAPYRLSSVFDHLRGNLLAADLMARGLGAAAVGVAERCLPVIEPIPVEDASPLHQPPALPMVPQAEPNRGTADGRGLAAAVTFMVVGLAVSAGGFRS